jgi:hypothetical protein
MNFYPPLQQRTVKQILSDLRSEGCIDGWPNKDTRHVFSPTANDRDQCRACLKNRGYADHITEQSYRNLKSFYQIGDYFVKGVTYVEARRVVESEQLSE